MLLSHVPTEAVVMGRGRRTTLAIVVLALLVGGGTYALTRTQLLRATAVPKASRTQLQYATQQVKRSATTRLDALRIVSVDPPNGAIGVGGAAPISITFSAPLSKRGPHPSLAPSTAGIWHLSHARTLVFTPTTDFVPLSQVTLTIPGGPKGVCSVSADCLRTSVSDTFTIANGSTLRLQQLLSLLDYSPLGWTPDRTSIARTDIAAQLHAMYSPPAGVFSWRNTGWPAQLFGLWHEGLYNVFTRGLVMSFQADHGLIVNGDPSAGLWNDLLAAVSVNDINTGGYNYAIGDKVPPESLTIWHDGHVVLRSTANTGIPQSPTPSGTFPVYARYRYEIMRGVNPNGQPYADPVQYVAYFYDGDAVHYFPRADYGIPQSLGCIELPYNDAEVAWPYLAYGTLVTVIN